MNHLIALLVIISVLYCDIEAKITNGHDVESNDLISNLEPITENKLEGDSSVKKDLNKLINNDTTEVKKENVTDKDAIKKQIMNENKEIEKKSYLRLTNSNQLNVSEEALRITNIVLSRIKEILEKEDQEIVKGGEVYKKYKEYVPVSEEIINPDFIPQGFIKRTIMKKNGLQLIDIGRED